MFFFSKVPKYLVQFRVNLKFKMNLKIKDNLIYFYQLQVTYQCRSGDVTSDTLRKCFSSQKRQNIWVVKASHLTTGNCIYFLHPDGIISLPKPVGPGKHVMAQLQSNTKNQLR